jgi:hypothetical protein
MLYLFLKSFISGIIIMIISEVARLNSGFAAFIASLPLISIISMIWIYNDTKDVERIANHSNATFWYVLPSLPMFLLLPILLRNNIYFYYAISISCLATAVLFW